MRVANTNADDDPDDVHYYALQPHYTTSHPNKQYSFNVIPKLGEVVANDAASYQYLVESIRRWER